MSSLPKTLETILVMNDNESVLAVVVAILKKANFLVLSADSGAAAIKLAEETEQRIDLLLSDVDMPL
jgi:CheY-like chemotaxis protein